VVGPASGGGRWVDVAPGRLVGWLDRFAERHGEMTAELTGSGPGAEAVTYRARDGSVAECHPPFPPLEPAEGSGDDPGPAEAAGAGPAEAARALARKMAEHAERDRTVGVLLVRLGGYAAGVFAGSPPRLLASKTGSRLVHGRSAAGGWSQQRFARRREKQAAGALAAAAGTAAAVFGPYRGRLGAVVLGGDRRAAAAITGDPRLRADIAPYLDRVVDRFLTVPEPRLRVLQDTPRQFGAVRIRVVEAPGEALSGGAGAGGSIAAGGAQRRPPGNRRREQGTGNRAPGTGQRARDLNQPPAATHSELPSANRWCFQIGTVSLSWSMIWWHAANASARPRQATATITAISPISSSPTRWTAETAWTGYSPAAFSTTSRSTASALG
jgi:Actinobacteria/chloroflexi VLRF1 release factor